MRYYLITLTETATGRELARFTSLDPSGIPARGALSVEFDLPVVDASTPMGAAFLRVWGVGLKTIGQAANFNGSTVRVYGGMSKGLPLANPAQQGLLASGIVQQAFGNWQGPQQSLDVVFYYAEGAYDEPANLVFNWALGQQLRDAVAATLLTAFPGTTVKGAVSDALANPQSTQPGFYRTLTEFAQYVKQASINLGGPGYSGLRIVRTQPGFSLWDSGSTAAPKPIAFTDLIGQPTWNGFATVNFKTVMRSDLAVGDFVRMPKGQQTLTAASQTAYRDTAAFQGKFQVTQLRHIGHSRQRDAGSWVTVVDAVTAGA